MSGTLAAEMGANLAAVRARIAAAAADCGRDAAQIGLVAIAKFQPAERVEAALAAGHRTFGENRVQEAAEKWPPLRARYPDVELHLVGHLQTNKAEEAVALFDVIESVDRERLAAALARAVAKTGRRPRCLVQVNTGEEEQKGGILPAEADDFVARCRTEHGLDIAGLMCIPPVDEPPAPHFALLREMARRNGLSVLSMGMSGDYEEAVRQGATLVRVGTAIFGGRPA